MKMKVIHTVGILLLIAKAQASYITDNVFGKNNNGIPAAFGDFNSDELTDLFVIRGNNVEVLLSSNDKEPILQASNISCQFACPVTSVVPGDFNGDAFMDILVSTKCLQSKHIDLIVLWGHLNNTNCTSKPIIKTHGEPMALDYNNDFITDLFGEDENGNRAFWIFKTDKTFEKIEFKKSCNQFEPMPIRQPHANAYLDLNNDCIADIFITSGRDDHNQVFELWYGTNKEKDVFECKTVLLPPATDKITKMGQSLFVDVELMGKMDHILPLQTIKESKLFVYSNNTESWHDLNLELTDPNGVVWQWAYDNEIPLLQGITVRSGDFNMDGYPDLLAPIMSKSGYQAVLLENVACTTCRNFTRTFQVKWDEFFPNGNDTVTAVFFDIFQDGVMDVILVNKKNDVFTLSAFKNNLDYDANFVKVMVLSGLQNEEISYVDTPWGKKRRTFGSNLPGPRIWYRTLDQEGNVRAGMSAQIPQSAHFALSLPYTTFALGRTPNFVDSLSVGFGSLSREWAQLIPNSQMVVIPNPFDNPSKWKVQLFVTPSKVILLSSAALLGTCLVILVVIIILHYKEKRSDKNDKSQDSFRFY